MGDTERHIDYVAGAHPIPDPTLRYFEVRITETSTYVVQARDEEEAEDRVFEWREEGPDFERGSAPLGGNINHVDREEIAYKDWCEWQINTGRTTRDALEAAAITERDLQS